MLVLLVALATLPPQRDVPYIVFPVLLWAAIRFGPRGASAASSSCARSRSGTRRRTTGRSCATRSRTACSRRSCSSRSRRSPRCVLAAVTAERTHAATALTASEASQRALADEQAALRRVATLVAGGAPPSRVFEQVTKEVARLLGVPGASLVRYDGARHGDGRRRAGATTASSSLPVASTIDLDGDTVVAKVLRTGSPQRVDVRGRGRHARRDSCRAPATARRWRPPSPSAGELWGALAAATRSAEPLPDGHRARACATSPSWSRRRSRTPTPTSSWPRRARASSRPATPSAGGSSATCTTARSSGSCRSRSTCAWSTRCSRRTRRPPAST